MLARMNPEPSHPFDQAATVEHSPEGNPQLRPLRMPRAMYEVLVAHLAASLPNEGCGLVAGVYDGETEIASRFYPGTNIDRSPVRYTMEPREVIDALREIRKQEWHLAAIVHSHPRTRPSPSRTDLAEAYYPDSRLIIVSFAAAEPEVACWSLTGTAGDREFIRAPLRVDEI